DWVITNCPDETLTTQAAQEANDVRWQIEELHRGLKQLTGTEKCQCRTGRSQRNHIACCYHAWLSLKVMAKTLGKTLYQTKNDLLSDYLRAELVAPRIQAFLPAEAKVLLKTVPVRDCFVAEAGLTSQAN
ncbi:MAG TPA: hypothetical protein VMJ90_00240, partial [Anaerolineales bacterium]|nr:hypothetical protein [Anaerolineales bacterium]